MSVFCVCWDGARRIVHVCLTYIGNNARISTLLQQQLAEAHIAGKGCLVQCSGAVPVPPVHVGATIKQAAHSGLVATPSGSVQDRGRLCCSTLDAVNDIGQVRVTLCKLQGCQAVLQCVCVWM